MWLVTVAHMEISLSKFPTALASSCSILLSEREAVLRYFHDGSNHWTGRRGAYCKTCKIPDRSGYCQSTAVILRRNETDYEIVPSTAGARLVTARGGILQNVGIQWRVTAAYNGLLSATGTATNDSESLTSYVCFFPAAHWRSSPSCIFHPCLCTS